MEERRGGLAATATRAASLNGAAALVVQVGTLVVYVFLARLAGPETFGLFAAAMILIGVGTLFAESGMIAALVHRRDRVEEAAATATVATLLGGVALAVLALAAAPLVGLFFDSRTTAVVAAAAAGILFLNGAAVVPSALLQRRIAVLSRQASELIGILVYGIVGVAALKAGLGVWALLIGSYGLGVSRTVSLWLAAGWWPDLRLASLSMWRELVGYGRHVVLGSALAEVGRVVSTALVGRLLGPVALGQFRFGLRLVTQGAAPLLLAASYVLLPALSRIAADDDRFRAGMLRSLRVVSLVTFPISSFLVALGVPLAVVLLGEEWRPAGEVIMALAGMTVAAVLISLSSEAFKARARPDLLPRVHVVWAVLSVVLMFALASQGAVGIAAAMSLGSLGAAAYALRRLAGMTAVSLGDLVHEIGLASVSAAAMATAVFALDRVALDAGGRPAGLGAVILVLEAAAGLGVYLSLITAVSPVARADLRDITRALLRRERVAEAVQTALPVETDGAL